MPKAEAGSTRHLAKQMKAKGLQRLRWYCQICNKQCRDENGFKQHTQSEGHVRAMLVVGEDPRKVIAEYSRQFQRDFLQLLKTSHGEKKVHLNNFYQEYIRDKEHVHMNATHWPSLTEFAKHLGRDGLCRVEEGERGLEVAWIDDSAEAVRRKEDIRRLESRAKGDEEMESRLLAQQIRRAKEAEREKAAAVKQVEREQQQQQQPQQEEEGQMNEPEVVAPAEPVKVSLSLKAKAPQASKDQPRAQDEDGQAVPIESMSKDDKDGPSTEVNSANAGEPAAVPAKVSLSLAKKSKPANPLAHKNPFAKKKEAFVPAPEKKMSNAERIMKEEIERKRLADERGYGSGKRQRRV